MKTICRLADFEVPNVSLYLIADDTPVNVTDSMVVVGDPAAPEFLVMDCNTSNCVLHEGVSDPGDWVGWKYTYTLTGGWELNPDWNPPSA